MKPMLVIAHRGASGEAPESTDAAIRLAIARGADMIELDVQMTRDRRLIMFHDERLERTTNGRGRVEAWRYADVARLDSGAWFAPRFAGARILLMSQALRMMPKRCRLNLELKHSPHPSEFIVRVGRCLRTTRRVRRVLVSSFESSLLRRLQAELPRISLALLCARRPYEALTTACRLRCVAFHPHVSLVTLGLVRRAHRHGLRVHVWTVDRIREAIRLRRLGVDGVVTNWPARLRSLAP